MKRTLLTAAVACALVGSAFAQGTIKVQAVGANQIYYSTSPDGSGTNKVAVGSPAQIPAYGNLNIAVYSAAPGTTLSLQGGIPVLTGWNLAATEIHTISGAAGTVIGTTIILNGIAEGANAQVEVVGWTGNFSDFASAYASGTALVGWCGSSVSGGLLSWTQATGAPNASTPTTPVGTPLGAAGFQNLVLVPVPEPSTIALAGLGAATLLLFRRRK